METPKTGIYRHYKNKNFYKVLGTAKHTETLEDLMVYEPLYENATLQEAGAKFFVRPLKMFLDEVEYEGVKQPRFQFIGNEMKPDLLNE